MSITTATEEIRARLGGEVILPADPGYDEARAIHNAMIDKRPAVDRALRIRRRYIATALEFARTSGLAVAVRGGGHNGPGFRHRRGWPGDRPVPDEPRRRGRRPAHRPGPRRRNLGPSGRHDPRARVWRHRPASSPPPASAVSPSAAGTATCPANTA